MNHLLLSHLQFALTGWLIILFLSSITILEGWIIQENSKALSEHESASKEHGLLSNLFSSIIGKASHCFVL